MENTSHVKLRFGVLTFVFLTSLLFGCASNTDEDPGTSCVPSTQNTVVNYDPTVKAILQTRCTSCHGGASPQSGLSLETLSGARSIVSAGDPQLSEMYQLINATGASRMPPSGGMSSEEITSIENWIATCAQ